jgi:hypothetical protein
MPEAECKKCGRTFFPRSDISYCASCLAANRAEMGMPPMTSTQYMMSYAVPAKCAMCGVSGERDEMSTYDNQYMPSKYYERFDKKYPDIRLGAPLCKKCFKRMQSGTF